MPWVPKYIIDGGMYAGRYAPETDLTGYIARFPNKVPVTNGFYVRDAYNAAVWDGSANNLDSDLILEYALTNKDGVPHTFDLMEFTAPNPEGAQYYRQSLIIEAVTECSVEQRNEVTISGVQYWATYVSIWFRINRIRRREYPTPYSTPTSTTLADFSGQPYIYFTYLTGGSEIALPVGYKNSLYDRVTITFGFGDYNNKTYLGVGYYSRALNLTIPPTDNQKVYMGCLGALEKAVIDDAFDVDFEPEKKDDPNEEDDEEKGPGKGGGGGGEGDHKLPDEGVPVPGLPEYGAAGVNWLTVYKMTQFQINEFGQELIDPDVWTIVKSFFTDPLDAIIGITLIPCDAPSTRTKHPEVGGGITGHTWANAYPVLNTEFVEIDCGNLLIQPYWDSAFDFDPFTKFSLFLPFVGFKPIKADDIMGGNIGVKYHVNVMTGDCTAFVTRTAASESIYGPMLPQVIGEYNGNCAIRVPIGRVSHDAAIDASMRLMATGLGMIGGAIAGQALGDPMNIGASQVSGQISGATMTAVNGMKQGIERSGSLGGSAGYMGNLKPFLIRTIPRQYLPDNYKQLNGYPANKGGTLNHYSGSGFQAIETIELDNLPAYDNEIDEIRTLLKGGVLV